MASIEIIAPTENGKGSLGAADRAWGTVYTKDLVLTEAEGISHNGIYRGKNLGTITSANINTFLAEHEVITGKFTNLYLGDYFIIQDGTYNKSWEIAGFDIYINKGDTPLSAHHLNLIPRNNLTTSYMNPTNTTEGGYKASYMHSTLLPQIDAKLSTVLGAHLLTRRALLTNSISATSASSAGAGFMGSANNWEWAEVKSCLMSEVEVYGTTVFSSSGYDVGEACTQLPVFQFKNHVRNSREGFWLKAVSSGSYFAAATNIGVANTDHASGAGGGVRPLICVG